MLTFLIGFAYDGPVKPLISINEYFSLILIVLVGLGLIFELPVLIFILSMFGIVTPKFLLKNFRYAMLIITVAAAIITPTPDATTMLDLHGAHDRAVLRWCSGIVCGGAEEAGKTTGGGRSAIQLKVRARFARQLAIGAVCVRSSDGCVRARCRAAI